MSKTYMIKTNPSQTDLGVIKSWLAKEEKNTGKGFYCKWDMIEDAFHGNKLICFLNEGKAIGFVVYKDVETHYFIEFMEIHPDYRRKGFGQTFYHKVEDVLKGKALPIIELSCSSKAAEVFWRKMNFIKFPDTGYTESKNQFYKPLIETCQPTDKTGISDKLELWDVGSHAIEGKRPRWTWELKEEDGQPGKPILQPCSFKWHIRWTRNEKEVMGHMVKRFPNSHPIEYGGSFIYIEKLEEKSRLL